MLRTARQVRVGRLKCELASRRALKDMEVILEEAIFSFVGSARESAAERLQQRWRA
jgi:hypothetical protein